VRSITTFEFFQGKKERMKIIGKTVCLVLSLLLLVSCNNRDPQALTHLRPNDELLAFGDSLTVGVGADTQLSYPAQLSRLLGRNVINAGVSGELSVAGARRLPGLLDKYEPELLILLHGGNDILQRRSRDELRANLRRMYEAAHQRQVEVVMIAVPQLNLGFSDAKLYQQLATELQIPLLSDKLGELLADPQYRSDSVHLNAQGYRQLAEAVADLLWEHGAL
jgi:lysophospholipase L1-like esterase